MIFLLVSAMPLFGPLGAASAASDYRFTVLKEECTLTVDPNGGAYVEYLISIQNEGGYIKGLDIRMPNLRYDIDTAQASILGHVLPKSSIKESSRYDDAVYVGFGSYPIPQNGLGTVWLKVWDPVMAIEDDKYTDHSRIKITPTWFPEDQNVLTKELVVTIKLPPDVPTYEVYTIDDPFLSVEDTGASVDAKWRFENIHWSKSTVRRSMGVRVPSEFVEAHSEFREITLYEMLDFFTPLNIAIIIGLIVLVIVVIILLNKAIGKRTPYITPSFSSGVSRVDHTLDPASFAYLDGRKPRRILALLMLLAVRDGHLKVNGKGPLRVDQGKKAVSGNNPCANLKDGRLDPEAVRDYFDGLKKAMDERGKSYDLEATKKHYGSRVDHAFTRLSSAKGPLEEIRTLDSEVGWMVLDRTFKKKWGKFLQDNEEVTIPEWMFLLLYEDREYTVMKFKPKGKDETFLGYIRDRAGSVFDLSGVTVDGEDTDVLLIDTIYQFEKWVEAQPEVDEYISTIRRYKPPRGRKARAGPPGENRGPYIRFGGGI